MVIAEGKQTVQVFNAQIVLFCHVFDLCGSPFAAWECAGACFFAAFTGYEYQVSPEILLQVRDQISKPHRTRIE